MAEIIPINQDRVFRLVEAQTILPVIRRITRRSSKDAQEIGQHLRTEPNAKKRTLLKEKLVECYQMWASQIKKLGVEPKGMWLVDFDRGDGYYCWKFPEKEIGHFHGYHETYHQREPL